MFNNEKRYKPFLILFFMATLMLTQIKFTGFAYSTGLDGENQIEEAILKPLRKAVQLKEEDGEIVKVEKNEFKAGEEFILNYTIQPRDIDVEEIIGDDTPKDKEIVLVMDISGSMAENIEFTNNERIIKDATDNYTSPFYQGNNVKDIKIKLKKDKIGNSITDFEISFNKPDNNIHNMKYFVVFSKESSKTVENHLYNLGSNGINIIHSWKRGTKINGCRSKYSFRDQSSLFGHELDDNEYFVYVATLNKKGNVIGLGRSTQTITNIHTIQKKLEVMKTVAKNFINKFSEDSRIKASIIPYSNIAYPSQYNDNDFARLIIDEDYEKIIQQINAVNANGGTNIGDGLRRSFYTLSNEDTEKYIILMTDGIPTAFTLLDMNGKKSNGYGKTIGYLKNGYQKTYYKSINNVDYLTDSGNPIKYFVNYGSYDHEKLARKYAEEIAEIIANSNKTIDTFMIGFSNSADKSQLKHIAKSADGYYKEAENGNALDEVYQQLADAIKANFSIPEINFREVIPKGMNVIEVNGLTDTQQELDSNGNTIVTGKAPSVAYNLIEKVDAASGNVIRYYRAEPTSFSINVIAEPGTYVLSGDEVESFIEYEDIDQWGKNCDEKELRKEYLNRTTIKVFTEESPTLDASLKENEDGVYLLSVTIDNPVNFAIADEHDNIFMSEITFEENHEGMYETYDEPVTFTKVITKSGDKSLIDSINSTDRLYVSGTDTSGNVIEQSISLIDVKIEDVKDYEHDDDLRPVTLKVTTDEGSIVQKIIVNGLEDVDFVEQITDKGIHRHINTFLKDGNNVVEVEIKNNDNNITYQRFTVSIDALSPEIVYQYNYDKINKAISLSLYFNEKVDTAWLITYEPKEEGSQELEEVILSLKDLSEEGNLHGDFNINEAWYKKEIFVKAKDLAGNIRKIQIPEPDLDQIKSADLISHDMYVDYNLEEGEGINIVSGFNTTVRVKLTLSNDKTALKVNINSGNVEKITNIKNVSFTLYRESNMEILADTTDNKNEILDITNTDNDFDVEILLNSDLVGEIFILEYKFTPVLDSDLIEENESVEMISTASLSDGSGEIEIKVNVVPLPIVD